MSSQISADSHPIGDVLSATNALWDVSEAHGACCGWACLGGAAAIQAWTAELLGNVDAADALAVQRQKTLYEFAAEILLKLEKGDLDFYPLLPADETPLDIRTTALAEWCQGFMHGLAAGAKDDAERAKQALEAEVTREVLEDFSQITRAAVGEDDEDEDDAPEFAYAELVEYVRVSAQLVYDESAGFRKHSRKAS
jgi:uncharacterized protein YgfB (UPF0149 family)